MLKNFSFDCTEKRGGSGDGTFQPAVAYSSGAGTAHSVVVGDVNNDGKPDLVVANACEGSGYCAHGVVSVLLGNGDGTFQRAVTYSSGGYDAYSVAVADVNNDSKPDLFVTNFCSDTSCANGTVTVPARQWRRKFRDGSDLQRWWDSDRLDRCA